MVLSSMLPFFLAVIETDDMMARAEKVFEAVQTRLSEVTPGNCHACLMDACAVAQEQCC